MPSLAQKKDHDQSSYSSYHGRSDTGFTYPSPCSAGNVAKTEKAENPLHCLCQLYFFVHAALKLNHKMTYNETKIHFGYFAGYLTNFKFRYDS